jgi:acetolactate synthase-1/2/3 large subunit
MKLSDYVLRFVADQGVKHVFLVAGGSAMHLNASLAQCAGLEPVCNSHEQASAMAAETYAKATGNFGVAMVTSGPGGTNAVTGLAGAWLDSTPMLFLSGQVKRPDRMFYADGSPRGVRQLGVQEIDILSIVRSLTKYAVTVVDPSTIRYHLEKAVYLAHTGRPGPVWIDIPLDVQAAPIDETALYGFDPLEIPPAFDESMLPAKVWETIEALNRSQRPLILVGNGVRLADAEEDFRNLVALLQVPVATTWCASGIVSSDDPLLVGRPGALAARGANFALQNSDFLLAVGARLDFTITGFAPDKLAHAAHKVVVDIDPAEIGKLAPFIQTEVCADAGAFLREMLCQAGSIKAQERREWKERCADWKTRYPVVLPEHRTLDGRVSVYHLAEVIGQESAPEDVLVSGSSGSGIEVFLLACPTHAGQRIYHTAGLAAMGYGLPAAIGACLAAGRRRTICVDGDGSFQFNIQELETVARLKLPIKFFVLNNNGYASIRTTQTRYFGLALVGCDETTGITMPDLLKVAAAYGLPGARISSPAGLREQVRELLDAPGPAVCDVQVIPDEVRGPRLSSSQRPDETSVPKPLEDLWPFLDREEFRANMVVSSPGTKAGAS